MPNIPLKLRSHTVLASLAIFLSVLCLLGFSLIPAKAVSTGTVAYDGSVGLSLGYTGTPFSPSSFWNTPLPDNTPISPNNTAYNNDIMAAYCNNLPNGTSYSSCPKPNNVGLNTSAWSAPLYVVPANQPYVTVLDACGHAANSYYVTSVLGPGVPVPADAHGATGTDQEIQIYQPSTNKYWDFWRFAKDGTGTWTACWGGVISPVTSSNGIFPNNTGATATSLPLLGGVGRAEELQVGSIDHVLALSVPDNLLKTVIPPNTAGATNGISWPATRTDGTNSNNLAIPEGQRFRLPANLNLNQYGMGSVAHTIAVAAQKYGFVVYDTAPNINIRMTDPTAYTDIGLPSPYSGMSLSMAGFPWSQLQALPFNYGINGPYSVPVSSGTGGGSSGGVSNINGGSVNASGVVTVTNSGASPSSPSTNVSIDGKSVGSVNGNSVTTSTSTLTNGPHKVTLSTVGSNGKVTIFSETINVHNPFLAEVLADYIHHPAISLSTTILGAALLVVAYTLGWFHAAYSRFAYAIGKQSSKNLINNHMIPGVMPDSVIHPTNSKTPRSNPVTQSSPDVIGKDKGQGS